jgi:hypothetical protein
MLLAVARCLADDTPVTELSPQFLGEIELDNFQELPNNRWYYNSAIIAGDYRVAMPFIFKQQDRLDLYQVPTKTVASPEHKFQDERTASSKKWRRYWSDLAFFKEAMRLHWPQCDVNANLYVGQKSIRTDSLNPFEHILLQPVSFPDHDRDIIFMDETARDKIRQEKWMRPISVDHIIDRWIKLQFEGAKGFNKQLETWKQIKLNGADAEPELGMHCQYCAYRLTEEQEAEDVRHGFRECWSREGSVNELAIDSHILNLPGHGVAEYLGRDYRWQSEVPEELEHGNWRSWLDKRKRFTLQQRQQLSLWDAKGKEVPELIIRGGLWDEMKKWVFPWHCIDFEAAHLPIPLNKHHKAYERLLFQFSCHTIQEDGTVRHTEWLHTASGVYPNFRMVVALTEIPDIEKGTLFQYSPFETQVVRSLYHALEHEDQIQDSELPLPASDLRERLKPLVPEANKGLSRWVDLHNMVSRFYFNRNSKSSLSLKTLTTAVMNADSWLVKRIKEDYVGSHLKGADLIKTNGLDKLANPYTTLSAKEFDVSEGSEALAAYMAMQIPNLAEHRREDIRNSLFQYGELDTLSLVFLLQHWTGILDRMDGDGDWIQG